MLRRNAEWYLQSQTWLYSLVKVWRWNDTIRGFMFYLYALWMSSREVENFAKLKIVVWKKNCDQIFGKGGNPKSEENIVLSTAFFSSLRQSTSFKIWVKLPFRFVLSRAKNTYNKFDKLTHSTNPCHNFGKYQYRLSLLAQLGTRNATPAIS